MAERVAMHFRGWGLAEDLFQSCGTSGRALGCVLIGRRGRTGGGCLLSFPQPDWAELESGVRERSRLWLNRGAVWGDGSGILRRVAGLWGERVNGESHESIGVCEIEHV